MKISLRNRFLALSLRTQLLLLAFLFALPSFALITKSGFDQRQDAIEEGITEVKKLASTIAYEHYNESGNAEQLLTVLAQLPEIKNRDVSAASAILADVLRKSRHFGNVIVTDDKGAVWASGLPLTIPISLRDIRTFKNAMRTRQFSSGEYVVGKISRKNTLGFGYPILNAKGEPEGVIAVNLDYEYMNEVIRRAGMPKGSSFSIVDHDGTIINTNVDPEKTIGTKIGKDLLNRLKHGPDEDTSIGRGRNGEKEIHSYRTLRLQGENSPYLYIETGIPLQGILDKALRDQIINMALLLSFTLFSILLTMYIANSCFLSRIDSLQEASQRIAEGDYRVRVADRVAGGQIGKLGCSFDEMASQLAERELELLKSEEKYRFLADNSADIIWRLGSDRRIIYISPADERLRGFRKDEVLGQTLDKLMPPEEASCILDIHSNRHSQETEGIKTGLARFEIPLVCKNGNVLWTEVLSSPIRNEKGEIIGSHGVARDINDRKKAEAEREIIIAELREALAEIKTLGGMLPICASCKKIRDDQGYWNQLEAYLSTHTDVIFSHGVCPDCEKRYYDEIEKMGC